MTDYSDLSFDWCSEVLTDIGYSIQARRILEPLYKGGANIKLIQNEAYMPAERLLDLPIWKQRIEDSEKMEDTGIRISFSVPSLYRKASKGLNIGYTMWETTRYPREWMGEINSLDRFWVGSEALVKSAKESGVRVPVDAVTACLDTTEWDSEGAGVEFAGLDEDTIVFMYIGSWIPRKNFPDLLTAFACEFDGQSDVALVIKTWGGDNSANFRSQVTGALQGHLNSLQGVSRPKISLIMDILEEKQIMKMLRRANIYTSPSRGEGFDLPLVQAMACGCLPVVNNFLAHGDYVTKDNAILYDWSYTPVYNAAVPLYHAYQQWSAPDLGSYMKSLREAYNIFRDDKDKLKKMTDNARETVQEHYDPVKNADRIATLIREVSENATKGDPTKELVAAPVS